MTATAARGAPVTYPLGTRRGLDACASPGGTFAVLALDHRQNLRKELRPDAPESVTYAEMMDFTRAVIRALAPHATGSLLASGLPWVLLSGGVDDVTFERQVTVACRAGASGVLVGRSVWAPAATMIPEERDAWLTNGAIR